MNPLWCNHDGAVPYLMHPIFNNGRCRGWWCTECGRWVEAIGREKLFTPADWHELKEVLRNETPE